MFMTKADPIKFFTKETLIAANSEAIKTNRNRTLEPAAIAALDADGLKFPVVFSMIHNDAEMRLMIALGAWEGGEARMLGTAWIDVPFETFNNLSLEETKGTD